MDRFKEVSIITFLLVISELFLSYVLQLVTFAAIGSASAGTGSAVTMILGAAAVIIINVICIVLVNKNQLNLEYMSSGMIIGNAVYCLLMIFLFSHIPVPYELVPKGEMALGLIQFLIRAADCIAGGVFILIGGVLLFYTKHKKNE